MSTYAVTRYFKGEPCPDDPTVCHAHAVTVTSNCPVTILSPTTRPEEIEMHWCFGDAEVTR